MKYPAAIFAAAALLSVGVAAGAQDSTASPGRSQFETQCGFCHGKDAGGGSTGPDLTSSELVARDWDGDLLGPVIRAGRVDKGMPAFPLSDRDLEAVVAYIHARKTAVDKEPGRRRGVTAADLSTGDARAGEAYFEGLGQCATCHSPTGDLAGISTRYRGLALLQRMLYPTSSNASALPEGAKPRPNPATVTVTLPSGDTIRGSLVHRDEFTIALRDASGWYRSWPASAVTVKIDDPLRAHAERLAEYTDADIHNLYAYLQSIK